MLQHVAAEQRTPGRPTTSEEYVKTLSIEWNATSDHFRLTVAKLPPLENVTKQLLVSDVVTTFNVLGWFSPTLMKVKILLQRLWELLVDWDDPVPPDAWLQWRSELHLSAKHISHYYFQVKIESMQLHGLMCRRMLAHDGL